MTKPKTESCDNATLVVLGAGASIGAAKYPIESSLREAMAKMPSGDNFFYDLFFQGKTGAHDERLLNVLGLTCEGVNDLIVRAWGLDNNLNHFDPHEWKQINIEEVFTFLDIGAWMYPRNTRYQRGFEVCRRELTSFITSLLSVKCEGFHCEHLMHLLFSLQPADSIISFNWDTIADFTIQYVARPIYAGYLELMAQDPPIVRDFTSRPVLLKLHGSLNWIACPNKLCSLHGKPRLAVKGKKLQGFLGVQKCPQCGNERGEPFIVPPTSQKLIRRDSLLHKLWLIARDKLQFARRLLFIGYSFPATDFYSEWLFRQVYFLEGHRPEIIVVNPEIIKKKSAVSRRYERLFRGCAIHRFPTLDVFLERGTNLLPRQKE